MRKLTPAGFADLVGQLTGAGPLERPAIIRGHEGAMMRVTIEEAAELMGYSPSTLRQYHKLAAAARRTDPRQGGLIPPWDDDRTWLAGDLALWQAGRPCAGRRITPPPPPPRVPRQRLRPRVDDRTLQVLVLHALRTCGRTARRREVMDFLRELGVHVSPGRVSEAGRAVQGALPRRPLLVSRRPDGLVTARELAAAYGVTRALIYDNVRAGALTAIPVKGGGDDAPGLLCFHPLLVCWPPWPGRTPVNVPSSPPAGDTVLPSAGELKRALAAVGGSG